MPRASSLPLLTKCIGSDVLPRDNTKSKNAKIGADWGTMAHTWKETGEIVGPDKRTTNLFAKAVRESGINRLDLWPANGVHESAVALRIDGTREVRRCHTGIFGKPEWVTGTGDFYWHLFDGELWVDDLKTGKMYPDENGENRFPQDPASPQLKFYALAIALLIGYSGTVHISVTHWPRLPVEFRHKEPTRIWATFTTDELGEFYGELERMYLLYAEAARALAADVGSDVGVRLQPGSHCRFCPSKLYCLVAQPDPEPYRWTRNQS